MVQCQVPVHRTWIKFRHHKISLAKFGRNAQNSLLKLLSSRWSWGNRSHVVRFWGTTWACLTSLHPSSRAEMLAFIRLYSSFDADLHDLKQQAYTKDVRMVCTWHAWRFMNKAPSMTHHSSNKWSFRWPSLNHSTCPWLPTSSVVSNFGLHLPEHHPKSPQKIDANGNFQGSIFFRQWWTNCS